MKTYGTDVVAEGIPGFLDLRQGRLGEPFHRGILHQPFLVFRQNPIHLCLLKHDFGNQDVIGVTGMAPRQISPVAAVPLQKTFPELALLRGKHTDRLRGPAWAGFERLRFPGGPPLLTGHPACSFRSG